MNSWFLIVPHVGRETVTRRHRKELSLLLALEVAWLVRAPKDQIRQTKTVLAKLLARREAWRKVG